MCLVFRKSAYPFGQVKTKMYLPESSFFKNSLAGARGQILMSHYEALDTTYIAESSLSVTSLGDKDQ